MLTTEPTTRPHAWHTVISLWSAIAMALSACGGGGGGETATATPASSSTPVPTPSPVPAPVPTPTPTPSPAPVPVPPNAISLFTGDFASPGNLDGAAADGRFVAPTAVYRLPAGDFMVVDNGVMRKVSKSGDVSAMAQYPETYTDTSGIISTQTYPKLGLDSQGNMLYGTGTALFKMTPGGTVSARTLNFGNESALTSISAIASDTLGNLWVIDQENLRKVSVNGTVTTLARSMRSFGSATGLAVDSKGNIYASSAFVSIIQKVTPTGAVSTFAGVANVHGNIDGAPTVAQLYSPGAMFVDASDNLIVTGDASTVRKITPEGIVSTIPLIRGPAGLIASNGKGGFIVPINGMKARLQEMDANGNVSTFSGPNAGGTVTSNSMAPLMEGNFQGSLSPQLTRSKLTGNLVLVQSGIPFQSGVTLNEWSGNGTVSTRRVNIPESNYCNYSTLTAATIDSDNNVLVSTYVNNVTNIALVGSYCGDLWKISPTGSTDNIWSDGASYPSGISTDASGNVLLVTHSSGVVKVITIAKTTGLVSERSLVIPTSIWSGEREKISFDKNGNIYIAANKAIWVGSANGQLKLLAGQEGMPGTADGQGTQARFGQNAWTSNFGGIAVDAAGNVWVSDTPNHTVRKIDPAGNVTTVAGTPGKFGNSLGKLPGTLYYPGAITVDTKGVVNVVSGDAILNISAP